MAVVVSIREIVDVIDLQLDESSVYLDPETGRLLHLTDEILQRVERGEGYEGLPEWQRTEFDDAAFVLASNRVLELPSKWDIHQWAVMREFALASEDDAVRDALLNAIRGSGAFRRFKAILAECALEDAWYQYREQALRKIVIEWCEECGVPYRD